jgi:glyoxylase-like metal-dependent hydrolase (beta-lactamase superfamily II)
MRNKSFRFQLGSFECLVVRDGSLLTPDGNMIDLLCLCIKTRTHTVLIDTGNGDVTPYTGQLLHNLQTAGIPDTEIDTIILTHGHPDHIGGIIGSDNQYVFPNARHYMLNKEWDYCTLAPDMLQVSVFMRQHTIAAIKKNLIPLKSQINLLEQEGEVVPGIKFIQTPGHTPGHISLLVSSGFQSLLCLGDLIHDTAEFSKPDLYEDTDAESRLAHISRDKILNEVLQPDTIVFASHFSFPGLGYIVKDGDAWQWQPVNISSGELL